MDVGRVEALGFDGRVEALGFDGRDVCRGLQIPVRNEIALRCRFECTAQCQHVCWALRRLRMTFIAMIQFEVGPSRVIDRSTFHAAITQYPVVSKGRHRPQEPGFLRVEKFTNYKESSKIIPENDFELDLPDQIILPTSQTSAFADFRSSCVLSGLNPRSSHSISPPTSPRSPPSLQSKLPCLFESHVLLL